MSVDVGAVGDVDGRQWLQLYFTSPERPRRFSVAYSPDSARRLVELLDAALKGLEAGRQRPADAGDNYPGLALIHDAERPAVVSPRISN